MRTTLFVLLALLPSCAVHNDHLADGTTLQSVSWGGKTYKHYSTKGGTNYTQRDDHEASFQAGVTGGVSAFGAWQLGLSNRASTASDTAIAVGAQKATTAQAAQAAAVETARIKASTIIPK